MANPAPVLIIKGTCHTVTRRHVPALEARAEQRDEQGNFLSRAREGRDAYDTTDVVVLTDGGGFATVVLSDDATAEMDGWQPSQGDAINLVVRPFIKWERQGQRSWTVVGLSVAGDLSHGLTGTASKPRVLASTSS